MDCNLLTKLRREGGNYETTNEGGIQLSDSQAVEGRVANSGDVREMDEISTINTLIRLSLDASPVEGTKKQKSSLFKYWRMYCVAFGVEMGRFGANHEGEKCEAGEAIGK